MGGVLGSSRASLVLLSALMLSWEQWVTVIAIEGFKTLKKSSSDLHFGGNNNTQSLRRAHLQSRPVPRCGCELSRLTLSLTL